MRRTPLLIAAAVIAACSGSTGPSSASPYNISVVVGPTSSGGGGAPKVTSLTLQVVDTGTGIPHAGVGVTLQVEAGEITTPLPNVTNSIGRTDVVWSIEPSLQTPGAIYALAYCAVPPGKTFCKTSLSSANAITVSF